jgi:hypothetical protein
MHWQTVSRNVVLQNRARREIQGFKHTRAPQKKGGKKYNCADRVERKVENWGNEVNRNGKYKSTGLQLQEAKP